MTLAEVLDYLDEARLQIALNEARDGLVVWPSADVTPAIAGVLRLHKPLLLRWLHAQADNALMDEVLREVRACLDCCACGALGTYRTLESVWYCDAHLRAYTDALWPPVDATTSLAMVCRLTADLEASAGALPITMPDAVANTPRPAQTHRRAIDAHVAFGDVPPAANGAR